MKYTKSIARPFPATRRKLYLAVAAQMFLAAGAQAGPTDGVVVAGEGQIDQSGLDTTITQTSDRLAIDWSSFNIQADERVQFVQPSESSVALNRILGSEASQIFGRLDANGHVILMNPNGVFFGEGATVDVGGLVASGLAINPDDFMNGDFALSAVEGLDGAVINQGIISAATGGNVVLVGQKVENQGLISAKLGSVTLAAGKEAVLTFDQQGLLGVRVSREILQNELGVNAAVNNSGTINAEGGRILLTGSVSQDIFSSAVNSAGLNAKTSVVMHDDGSFTLGAGANVVNTGTLNASNSSDDAGQIVVLGDNIQHSGAILADSQGTGKSGDIELHSKNTTLLTQQNILSATAAQGEGGAVKVLGDRVGVFDETQINTSGANGGGDIHIGGGFQGKNPNLRNATRTVVGKDTTIKSDALQNGKGGEVIVWADQTTAFTGDISVRGGTGGGDGGFVEVSGKQNLKFDGRVDRTAVEGKNGTLLLDPDLIWVLEDLEASPLTPSREILFSDEGQLVGTNGFSVYFTSSEAINAALESGDVRLQAAGKIWFDGTSSPIQIFAPDETSQSSLLLEAGLFVGGVNTEIILGEGDLGIVVGNDQWCVGCVSDDFGQLGRYINGNEGIRFEDSALATNGNINLYSYDDLLIGSTIVSTTTYLGRDLQGNLVREFNNVNLGSQGYTTIELAADLYVANNVDVQIGDLSSLDKNFTTPNGTQYSLPDFRLPARLTGNAFFEVESPTSEFAILSFYIGGNFNAEVINPNQLLELNYPVVLNRLRINTSNALKPGVVSISTNSQLSAPQVGPDFGLGESLSFPVEINFLNTSEISPTVTQELHTGGGNVRIETNSQFRQNGDIFTGGGNYTVIAGDFSFNSLDSVQINTDIINGTGNTPAGSGNIDLVFQQDVELPEIVSSGILSVESVLGNIRSSSVLNITGDTTITAAENINLGEGFSLTSSSGNAIFSAGQSLGLYQFFLGVPVIGVGGDVSLSSGDGPVNLTGIYNARSFEIGSLEGDFFGEQVEINSETSVDINLPNGVFDFVSGQMTVNAGSFSATAQGIQIGGVTINTDISKGNGDISLIATGSDLEYDIWMPTINPDGAFTTGDLFVSAQAQGGSVRIGDTQSGLPQRFGFINLSGSARFDVVGDLYLPEINAVNPQGDRDITLNVGGVLYQNYDVYTGGGNFLATASELVFNDGIQINTDFSNSTSNSLVGTGNISLTETVADFLPSSRMILPSIRTQGDCAGRIQCGDLDIKTNRNVLDKPFGDVGVEKHIKVFGTTSIVSGALDLTGELSNIQFDGLFSLDTGYVSLFTKGGLRLSDWRVNGTTHVAVDEVEGRSSDIISNSALDVGWPAVFSTPGELILQGDGTRFRTRVSLQGSRVQLNHDGDLDLEGLFLTGGPGGAASIINVNGNVTSSANGARFVEPATDRALRLDIIGGVVDGIYQQASAVVFNVTGDLLLSSPDSQISSIQILNAQNVQLTNSTDMDVAGINAQSLRLDTTGNVTQSGAINVSGESLFNLSGLGSLTFENATNNFNEVTINSSSTSASRVTDRDDLVLGNITASSNIQIISLGDDTLVSQKAGSQINLAAGGLMSISADNIHLGESASSIQMDGGSLTLTAEQSLSFSGAISGIGATPGRLAASVTAATGAELNVNATATFSGFDADTSLISLGDGNDVINVASNTPFYIEAGLGDDTFNVLAEGLSILNLNGNEGIDSLIGANADSEWFIEALNEGQLISSGFITGYINIENLVGGERQDSFTISTTAIDGMTLNGGGGGNLIYADDDSLADNSWTVDGINAGTLNEGLLFSNIQNLEGNSGNDTFTFSSNSGIGNINAGAGSDTFELAEGIAAGTLDGGDGTDSLTGIGTNSIYSYLNEWLGGDGNYTPVNIEVNNTIGGSKTIVGVDGYDAVWNIDGDNSVTVTASFGGVETINRFTGVSRLEGASGGRNDFILAVGGRFVGEVVKGALFADNGLTNYWVVDGLDSGTLRTEENGSDIIFSEISDIGSETGSNIFDIRAGAALTGVIGAQPEATIFASDDLIDNNWTLNELGAGGSVNGISFFGPSKVRGSGGDDTFVLVADNSEITSIDGGLGNNTLQLQSAQGASINLETGTVYDISVNNIINYIANGGDITGANSDSLWILDNDISNVTYMGLEGTERTIQFSGIDSVIGGSAADDFRFLSEANIPSRIEGGGGEDSLVGPDVDVRWQVGGLDAQVVEQGSLSYANQNVVFNEIENLAGGSGNDEFHLYRGVNNLVGGAGDNSLWVYSDSSLVWEIDTASNRLGSADQNFALSFEDIQQVGTDVLGSSGAASTVYVLDFWNAEMPRFNLDVAGYNTLDFSREAVALGWSVGDNIFDLIVGNSLSEFRGSSEDNVWLIEEDQISVWVNATFDSNTPLTQPTYAIKGFAFYIAGNGNDDFVVEGENVSVVMQGEGGINRVFGNLSNGTTNNNWILESLNFVLNDQAWFEDIQSIQGNASNDTFIFSPNSTIGSINAGAGDDTFVLANNITTGLLDGGEGQDTLNRDGLNSIYTYLNQVIGGDAVYTTANIEIETNAGGSTTVVAVDGYDAEWTIEGDGSVLVTASDAGGAVVNNRFTSVTRLEGGSGADEFILLAGGAISGGIFGNGDDSLRASDTTNTWTINAANSGELAVQENGTTLLFEGVANLIGGAGADLFDVVTGGSITGSIDGGLGPDSLQISDAATVNNWQLGAQNSLNISTQFQAIEALVGNINLDTFNITGVTDVLSLDGGLGGNALNWSAGDLVLSLAQNTANQNLSLVNIQSIAAEGTNNTLIGADSDNSWVIGEQFLMGGVGTLNLTGATVGEGMVNSILFTGFNNLVGGVGQDALRGMNAVGRWQIGLTANPTLSTLSYGVDQLVFSGMETLVGGVLDDNFVVDVLSQSITLVGGEGVNSLQSTQISAVDNLWTIGGDNSGNFSSSLVFSQVQNLIGGGNNDTFTFSPNATIGSINAGAGNDTFILANNITAGVLDGGEGIDVLDRGALNSVVTYLRDVVGGDAVYSTANIETENSSGGSTTVVGVAGYSAKWDITGAGTLSVTAIRSDGVAVINEFTGVTRAEGGDGFDEFVLLDGGALADGVFGSGNDYLQGSETTNTWTINAANSGELAVQETGTRLRFNGIANLYGGNGNDSFDIASGGSISGAIYGGGGTDTLSISDATVTNNWQLGESSSVGAVAFFAEIENLVGNANNDIFNFAAISDVRRIEGRGGNNTLEWHADEVVINLCGCVESNDVEFSGINSFVADATFNNTIIGLNEQNTWTLTGADSGTVNTVNFSGFKVLQGGTAADTLFGFDDTQTWRIAEQGNPQLNSLSTPDKQISFSGMESLRGGAGQDAFYVDTSAATLALSIDGGGGVNLFYANVDNSLDNEWTLDGVNAGTLNETVLFNNIQNLEGNAGVDTVTFARLAEIGSVNTHGGDDLVILADAVIAGLLDGGAGNNVLRLFGLSTAVDILGRLIPGDDNYNAVNFIVDSTDGGFVTVRGLDDVDAEWRIDGDGTLTVLYQDEQGQQRSVFHPNVARLEAANANDTFVLLEGGQLFDAVVGNGADILRVENNLTNNWVVNNADTGQVTTAAGVNLIFEGIANLIGGSGSDIFDIATGGAISGSIDGGGGADTLRISDAAATNNWQLAAQNAVGLVNQFRNVESLVGNANNDSFILLGSTDVLAVDGAGGANRLTGFDQNNTWNLTAANTGNVTGLEAFSNIQTLIGGSGADTFTLAAGSSVAEIYGGAGDDNFVIGRDVTADNIFGEAGDDSFDVDLGLILSGALDGGTGGEVAGDYLNLNKFTVLTASTDLEALLGFAFRSFERIDQPNTQGVYSGGDATNFWFITGQNQGRLEIRDGANAGVYEFSGVHSLRGGSGEDVFIFANDAAAVTTIIDGGAGAGVNTLDLSAQGLINQWLISGVNSGSVSNSSNTTGNLFTNIAYLIGGGNRDDFSLQAGGTIAGGVDGGLGEDQLSIASTQASTWTLGGASGHTVTGIANFDNIESLVGSAGDDTFNVLSETLDVARIDGAAGSDSVNFQFANPVVVNLRDGLAGGLLVSAIERFISGNVGSTLIANDTRNSWALDGANSGSIRYLLETGVDPINVAFDGFGNLQGGAVDDQFSFLSGGALSGQLDGGAGTDSVDLQARADEVHVSLDPTLANAQVELRLEGLEQLLGNGRTWLYGASDQSYTWTIDGQRSGQVTSTLVDTENQLLAFENLSAIVGGAHDDIFRVTLAAPLLSLDGGAAVSADLVDYSQVSGNLRINLATALSGQNGVLAGVEGIRGNNAGPDSLHSAELVAADADNRWVIGTSGSELADAINDGQVTSAGQTIQFLDFNLLTGGAGVDSFVLDGGVLLGTLNGGAGNDVFDVALAGANSGTLIDGGLGLDSLTLTGGDTAGVMTYTAAVNGGEFDYSLADVHFKLSHQAVETIRDNSRAQTLEIRGSNLADTIGLANGSFQINAGPAVDHSNKTRIAVRSGINDIIEINDHLMVAESLTLANGTVIANDPANSSITTALLVLEATRDVGLASARLRTSVDDLVVRNSAGDIYLQEQNGLNLAEFTANGVFDLLLLNGDLTSSAALATTDVFRVNAGNGNITLRGDNQLRDDVALSGARVELHNASTLTLVDVTAGDLILRTQRGIEGDGPLVVSGLTEIDAQGDVRLDFSSNDFNRVRVTNAWNLTLVDQNTLELLDINASGTVVVRSANNIELNNNLAGGTGVDVASGSGSINQNGSIITGNGSVVISAGMGAVNLGEDARIVSNGGSVNISAGNGNVNMGADTRIAANGGNVNIEAAESVVVAEVISSGNVAINAGSGSVTDGNGGTTNVVAGALQSSSNTGFGSEDSLETQVGSIDVSTNTGNVGINNTGEVTVEAIRTSGGSITVTNQGNVDLAAGSVSATNGDARGDVSLDVNLGSVRQTGPSSVPAIVGGTVLINAPEGAVGEGDLRVNAEVVRIIALSKAGEIFVNPGADKIEYFSGSFKFEDQLLSVEPLDDIDPAIFTNVRSYFYNDISLLLPSDQRYDEDEEEEEEGAQAEE